jgi:bacteriocin-like protein
MKKLDTKTLQTVSGGALVKIGNTTISPVVTLAPMAPLLSTAARIS